MTVLDIRETAERPPSYEVTHVDGARLPWQVFTEGSPAALVAAFVTKEEAEKYAAERNGQAEEIEVIEWGTASTVQLAPQNVIETAVYIESTDDRLYVPVHELPWLIKALQKAHELWGPKA